MLTDTQADIVYEKALDALDLLIDDDGIAAKERAAAERKRKRLTLVYIGKAIQDIEARTAKFQAFIEEMQELIDKFDPATTVAAIGQLGKVVQEAGQLVEAATGAVAAVPKAGVPRAAAKTPARGRARVATKASRPANAGGTAKPQAKAPARKRASAGAGKAGGATKAPTRASKTASVPAVKRASPRRRPAAATRAGKARP